MKIEYEATFLNINKVELKQKLAALGADLIKKEFLQKRECFSLPVGNNIVGGWLRVRDEGDQITMSLKVVNGDRIQDQKETQLIVDSFGEAHDFLINIGCRKKAYQESRRELWRINRVDITIDEWPFLEPFVEIEGPSEEDVRLIAEQLGFNYRQARFCSVDTLYHEKYGTSLEQINENIPQILFEMDNPFLFQ